jgi:segregation and condensation protein B
MEQSEAKKILEAVLFITETPITLRQFENLFDKQFSKEELQALLQTIAEEYRQKDSALEAKEIAGGWQMSTRSELGPWIRKLFKDRLTYRLSNSAMETLSIVAYKQPITRHEVEEIRGVEVTAVLDTLVDRKLLKVVGRRESVGRPILFGTTPEFLRAFGLNKLEDMPSIESLIPPAALDETGPLPTEAPPEQAEGAAPGDVDVPETVTTESQN